MKKRLTLLLVLLLGGILVMTACKENKNSREWIENKVSQVSRVYPTENLFDLFEEFPEGFKVYQVYFGDERIIDVTLIGDSQDKSIKGTIVETVSSSDEESSTVEVEFVDNQFVFSDSKLGNELWQFKGFLFQGFSINKQMLSNMEMKSKSFSEMNSSFDITYSLKSTPLNLYFNKQPKEETNILIGSSLRNDDGYYYSVVIDYGDGHYFRETVSDLEEDRNGE